MVMCFLPTLMCDLILREKPQDKDQTKKVLVLACPVSNKTAGW